MMMRRLILLLALVYFSLPGFSQYVFSILVTDAETGGPLPGVSIVVQGDAVHTVTASDGKAWIRIKPGTYIFHFSSAGYLSEKTELTLPLPPGDSVFIRSLTKKEQEDIIIHSSRINSKIENTPIKAEVVTAEELDKESGIKPAHVINMLNNIAGIQARQTSAVTGNTDLRIQGLPGGYTQLLRDGMPLFGGYAGSFSILEIPTPDLKQIEIIKGPGSAMYGSGAVAGMINIISKKPNLNEKERYLLLNQSSLQETNFNIYLSERIKKTGYTFFAGGNYQKQKDINNDGFSDVTRVEGAFIHPTLYFYPNERNTVSIGVNSVYGDRIGGDMELVAGYYSNFHQFFIQNQTYRNTFDLMWDNRISQTDRLTLKASTSSFNRSIGTSLFGMKAKQLSWYSEFSYVKKIKSHELVAGINFNGERLKKRLPDSTLISNYAYHTPGFFVQDDWRIHPKLTAQGGLRADFHNNYGAFVLPRLSVLYKINHEVTMRFGGGLGYKIPTVFESDIDERDYQIIAPLENVKAERSAGLNWDINYKKKLGKVTLTINQSFYYTQINDPLVRTFRPGLISFHNESKPLITKGIETSLGVSVAGLEACVGYTLADARKKYDALQPYIELSARNKFASVISYKFSERFRACIEAAYTGKQYLENGVQSSSYPVISGMVQWNVGRFSFVVNCENINDYRQTKKEEILIPPVLNPRFKQLWAPIDGRVVNLSMRIKL